VQRPPPSQSAALPGAGAARLAGDVGHNIRAGVSQDRPLGQHRASPPRCQRNRQNPVPPDPAPDAPQAAGRRMTRAAAKATAAAEDLLAWLRSQARSHVPPSHPVAPLPGPAAENPGADILKDLPGPDSPGAAAPASVPAALAPGPRVGSGKPAPARAACRNTLIATPRCASRTPTGCITGCASPGPRRHWPRFGTRRPAPGPSPGSSTSTAWRRIFSICSPRRRRAPVRCTRRRAASASPPRAGRCPSRPQPGLSVRPPCPGACAGSGAAPWPR
jgi:hypothetical protein